MALISGADVFTALNGYTTKREQKDVIDSVSRVNSHNIMYFLKSYNNSAVGFEDTATDLSAVSAGLLAGGVVGGFIGLGIGELANLGRKNKPVEGFFHHLVSEFGFDEKQQISKNMAQKLKTYLAANGFGKYAESVNEIIKDGVVDRDEARKLDDIVATVLEA